MHIESIFLLVLALYFALQTLCLCGVMYMAWCYIRVKRAVSLFKRLSVMDSDELLESLLAEPREQPFVAPVQQTSACNVFCKRVRLPAAVSGGRKVMFKRQTVKPERVDAMGDAEIEGPIP